MSATAAVDRAGVHAGTAADAVQRIAKLVAFAKLRAAVVDQHDVQFAVGVARAVEMRRVAGDRLTGGRRASNRVKTARVLESGINFSIPMQAMWTRGNETPKSALPSFVQTTKPPVSAMAKLTPVMPTSPSRNLSRRWPRAASVR